MELLSLHKNLKKKSFKTETFIEELGDQQDAGKTDKSVA